MKFGNAIAASVGYKHIIAIVLLVLHAPLFADPVTFEASGNWVSADIPPFETTYTAILTFDNGGTSATNQLFIRDDFISLQINSGTASRNFPSYAIVWPGSWVSDFASNATGVLTSGGVYLQTQSGYSSFQLSDFILQLTENQSAPAWASAVAESAVFSHQAAAPPTATLTLAKTVVNDEHGTAVDTDFTLTATGPDVISGVEGDLSITSAVVAVGDYALTESALAGYTQAGWSCTSGLSGSTVTLAADDVVTCTATNTDDTPPPPASTYTIGGSVSGLTGSVTLQNNAGDDLIWSANSSFAFATALEEDSPYAVTVLSDPTDQTCSVTNGSGTVAAADVTDVAVTCVDDVVVVPPTPARPIPTLSQWALIMLSMFLGLMVFANRRRLF
jgi:hypothetical protein